MERVQGESKLSRGEIKGIENLLKDIGEKIKASSGTDRIALHQEKIGLYTRLFKSELDKKYRKELAKEHQSIVRESLAMGSYGKALKSIEEIIKIYDKLFDNGKVAEWENKEKIVKGIAEGERSIEMLEGDVLYDESESIELHTEVLEFYKQLLELEIDGEYKKRYREKYIDHLEIVVHRLYTQKSYDKALSYAEELIKTCEHLDKDKAKRHTQAKDKLVTLFRQSSSAGLVENNIDNYFASSSSNLDDMFTSAVPPSTPTLEKGNDSYARYSLCKTPSRYGNIKEAFQEGNLRALGYRLLRGELDESARNDYVRLICIKGDKNRLKEMIKESRRRNYDLDVYDKDGNLPIHNAAINGREDLVKLLINDKKERIGSKTKSGEGILELAVKNSRDNIVQLLSCIDNGFLRLEMGRYDKDGCLPIHHTVSDDNISMLRLLVDRGADVNSIDIEGRTPLELAFRLGHMDIVQGLRDLGCDDNKLDTYREKAMNRAIQSKDLSLMETLLPHMKNGRITYDYRKIEDLANLLGRDDILRLARKEKELSRSLSSKKDSKGETAIRLVDRSSVAELLTKNGTSNNSENSQGKTPLRLPALSGSNSDCLMPSGTPKSLRDENAQSSVSQRKLNRIRSQSSSFSLSDNWGEEALTSQMRGVRRNLSMSSKSNESGNYGIDPSSSIENPTVERQENISRGMIGRN